MNTFNILSLVLGIVLIFSSVFMLNKNIRQKLAVFVALGGLFLIIGAIVDPNTSIPGFFMSLAGMN